jgi:hypothetical protein
MELNGTNKNAKKCKNYECKKCAFITSNKYNYSCHIKTIKHLGNEMELIKMQKMQKMQKDDSACICGKTYKTAAGLWKHKKNCIKQKDSDKDQMLLTLIKQNAEQNAEHTKQTATQNAEHTKQTAELHATIIEMCKNGTHNTVNTNSHNKTFNLQFFLNETCKDAMNIKDFVNSVVLQLSDIDEIGRVGFIKGMSNIITSKLNLLAENKRPVHCTDAKREVMYIKEENKWEKDNANKEKMRLLVKKIDRKLNPIVSVFHKQIKPNSTDNEHIRHQQILFEVWGGTKEPAENENEIIQNISKKTTIEKATF